MPHSFWVLNFEISASKVCSSTLVKACQRVICAPVGSRRLIASDWDVEVGVADGPVGDDLGVGASP